MKQWLVTTRRVIEEDWRVYAETAEEAKAVVKGPNPEADSRVLDFTIIATEGLEFIPGAEPYKV